VRVKSPNDSSVEPLFTDADVTLVEDAIEREGQRIELFCELYNAQIDPDHHPARLRDLAARLRRYVRAHAPGRAP
jgi:pyridoxine 5'-phosphate synthase PdxJ